ADILRQCRGSAAKDPGFFSLTVPTGGGKTLSGMAFAMDHALIHGKRRIIHVIPYTSIIEQTANIFRKIFDEAVIEHHSSLDPDQETARSRLAVENWDAPVIVTTSVQFFESLFAARTSRCRKLHNLVDSVVVLDEVQLLPPAFLQPILDTLNLLVEHYGVTVVLSTATQPALETRRDSFGRNQLRGLDHVHEIIADPDVLYSALERVRVHLPDDLNAGTDWQTIANEVTGHDSVLVIVNTRRQARELHALLPPGTIHLSALMCGEHRSDVIAGIKQKLNNGEPMRVVSTQLVEAGVDLDFPVVYRALAGLDSIAQAAGRCNREGRLASGEVVVFVPPEPAPPGMMRRAAAKTVSVLAGNGDDPLARSNFSTFFRLFYDDTDLDEKK
ncbi:CRISPR-associated helicase Cas3', partial [Thiolapillus sp.]